MSRMDDETPRLAGSSGFQAGLDKRPAPGGSCRLGVLGVEPGERGPEVANPEVCIGTVPLIERVGGGGGGRAGWNEGPAPELCDLYGGRLLGT